jgi:hypothetical protein
MLGEMRIRIKPVPKRPVISFDDILADPVFSRDDRTRLRGCMVHERRERADYHTRRYLRHLSEDELHARIGHLIANVVYVSARNRYSANNFFSNYWRGRLAQTAEELVMRGSTKPVPTDVLQHLPLLGFPTPSEPRLTHERGPDAFYRYDRLRYLKTLRSDGEIFLRCASTEDATDDVARRDANELCLQFSLLAEDLDLTSASPEMVARPWMKTLKLKIFQKTDYYMFCLSSVYDWRLFGDFSVGDPSGAGDDTIGCLVITDPREFTRRFAAATAVFKRDHDTRFSHPLRLYAQNALYYDACDAQECAPLFEDRLVMPFAKRREFTYQHEFRFIIRPDVPDDSFPTCAPEDLPRFERAFLRLGSLEDISKIIEPDTRVLDARPYYLSAKNLVLLSSAVGVTLPNSGDMVRFTYSQELKEVGRTDATNLTNPTRYGGASSMQMHEKHIDVPADSGPPRMLLAIRDFYTVFDVREHGNHLFSFEARDPADAWNCSYRAYLPCAEPADDKIDPRTVVFEFEYAFHDRDGRVSHATESVELDGHTYQAQYNGVGPLHVHETYRSLLIAEMTFIQRLIDRGFDALISYEVKSRETECRCSEFNVTSPSTSMEQAVV